LSSSHIPLEPNIFDLVVFDESSQCDIASAIPLLYRSKRAVIIGDDKQLKHITSLSTQMDGKLLSDHKIDLPYSYTQNSLIDIFSTISNNKFYLKHHFRSHNDIIAFSSKQWYGGKLIVETKYEKLKLLDSEKSVEWYDVIGNVQNLQSGSIYNSKEVEEVFKIIEDLIYNKKYKGSIGVVSPFRPQVNKLEEYKVRDIELNNILNGMDFNIDTVNKFQGDEKDIIIFSVTINGGAKKGALDFLKYTSNLFNVAITRARAKLIIVGDSGYCRKCGIDYLEKFVEYCVNLGINTFKNNVFKNKFESEWEENLYKKLKENSIEVIPQYTIDKYRLDFALIDEGGRKLDIEVDGEYYHRDWDGELIKYDQARNQRLIELGWDVMRFWVFEIRDNIDICIEKIKKWQKR
jgi:superfamily I DNA and/or RNA helicase/very-short-patch-repair endonuclease